MHIALLKETRLGECRVALVPESCKKLLQSGYSISIEKGAGEAAFYSDEEYRKVGCVVEQNLEALIKSADFVLKVNPPTLDSENRNEIAWMKPGTMFLASLMPLRHLNVVQLLATHKITSFSLDSIPRTTRAQSMDTLSSMANIVGYKGVLLAASELSKYFPMFMTAAGTVFPAKVFVIGAAVAGLQAIATARRLGANVTATDVRPEVKEQIESLGAKYIGIELKESAVAGGGYAKELSQEDKLRQRELLAHHCATVDVVITTALIGGIFAPKLITEEMVKKMRPGSIIVDLAGEGGGNCELSRPGEAVVAHGIKIITPLNIPSSMATHASLLFSRNLTSFVQTFTKDKNFQLDLSDDIQKNSIITHKGEVVHAPSKKALKPGEG